MEETETQENRSNLENPIILNYLIEQHRRVLSHIDSMDLKIAQILALNGLLLSFVFDKLSAAQNHFLFLVGLFCIIISLGIGVIVYTGMEVCYSPDRRFYDKSNDPEKLKKALIKDIFGTKNDSESNPSGKNSLQEKNQHIVRKIKGFLIVDFEKGNDEILRFKGQWFNLMLKLIIVGLIVLVVGYYAK